MLKPQAAQDLIKESEKEVEWHGMEYGSPTDRDHDYGWYYVVLLEGQSCEWFSYPAEIQTCLSNYSNEDRIHDIFVEDGDLFISVDHWTTGSTVLERFSLGKSAVNS